MPRHYPHLIIALLALAVPAHAPPVIPEAAGAVLWQFDTGG